MALLKAMMRISDRKLHHAIVALIEQLDSEPVAAQW
jgi:hypothetical protein